MACYHPLGETLYIVTVHTYMYVLYVCVYVRTCMYVCVCVCMYMYVFMYVHVSIYVSKLLFVTMYPPKEGILYCDPNDNMITTV